MIQCPRMEKVILSSYILEIQNIFVHKSCSTIEVIMEKVLESGNRNKGKGNGAGLAWESQSHCFADEFGITHAHSFGADTHTHDVFALIWLEFNISCNLLYFIVVSSCFQWEPSVHNNLFLIRNQAYGSAGVSTIFLKNCWVPLNNN